MFEELLLVLLVFGLLNAVQLCLSFLCLLLQDLLSGCGLLATLESVLLAFTSLLLLTLFLDSAGFFSEFLQFLLGLLWGEFGGLCLLRDYYFLLKISIVFVLFNPIFSHLETNTLCIEKKVRVKRRAFWATILE